ncbi:MAG: DUF2795 domain-containing protein [Chloroflexota bacterium]
MVSTATIAYYVRDLSFPCTKQECIQHVREQNAPPEVIDVLERMPDRPINNIADLWTEVGKAA